MRENGSGYTMSGLSIEPTLGIPFMTHREMWGRTVGATTIEHLKHPQLDPPVEPAEFFGDLIGT